MLETDLDIALSQGKTIDAREFAEQLILRGQPFRLAFMDGKRNTNIPDCVVLSIADAYDVPRIEVMLPTLHPADPIPTVSVQVVPLTKGASLSIAGFGFHAKDAATTGRAALFPIVGCPTLANVMSWAAASYYRVSLRVHDTDDAVDYRVNVQHHTLCIPAGNYALYNRVSLLVVPVVPQRDGILIHVFLKSASYDESL